MYICITTMPEINELIFSKHQIHKSVVIIRPQTVFLPINVCDVRTNLNKSIYTSMFKAMTIN